MNKLLGVLAATSLFATAASATVTTIEYAIEGGDTVSLSYDDSSMTVSDADGNASDYTYDEAGGTVCSNDPDGKPVCATFESTGSEVGHTTPFSTDDGRSGTATITNVE